MPDACPEAVSGCNSSPTPLSSFSQACPGPCLRDLTHLHGGRAQKESLFNAKYQQGSQGVNYSSTSPAPICLQSALLAPLRTHPCRRTCPLPHTAWKSNTLNGRRKHYSCNRTQSGKECIILHPQPPTLWRGGSERLIRHNRS